MRYIKDVEFVIQLIPDNIIKTFEALATLGYKPLVPITAEQFADQELRESWIRDKAYRFYSSGVMNILRLRLIYLSPNRLTSMKNTASPKTNRWVMENPYTLLQYRH